MILTCCSANGRPFRKPNAAISPPSRVPLAASDAMTLELAIILFSIAAMLMLLGSVMANVSLLQRRMDALEQRIAQVLEYFEEVTTHDA